MKKNNNLSDLVSKVKEDEKNIPTQRTKKIEIKEIEENNVGVAFFIPKKARQILKKISVREEIPVREIILIALIDKYDELKEFYPQK